MIFTSDLVISDLVISDLVRQRFPSLLGIEEESKSGGVGKE